MNQSLQRADLLHIANRTIARLRAEITERDETIRQLRTQAAPDVAVPGALNLYGQERIILRTLMAHAPRFVSSEKLCNILFANQIRENPKNQLSVSIRRLRVKLAKYGPNFVASKYGDGYALPPASLAIIASLAAAERA